MLESRHVRLARSLLTSSPAASDRCPRLYEARQQEELRRLHEQHEVWLEQARALWARAGLGGRGALLDLGCGPGYTSLDLAAFAGSETRVIAVDESERFVDVLRRRLERSPGSNVVPRLARVQDLGLEAESIDGAYARWLLSWRPRDQRDF